MFEGHPQRPTAPHINTQGGNPANVKRGSYGSPESGYGSAATPSTATPSNENANPLHGDGRNRLASLPEHLPAEDSEAVSPGIRPSIESPSVDQPSASTVGDNYDTQARNDTERARTLTMRRSQANLVEARSPRDASTAVEHASTNGSTNRADTMPPEFSQAMDHMNRTLDQVGMNSLNLAVPPHDTEPERRRIQDGLLQTPSLPSVPTHDPGPQPPSILKSTTEDTLSNSSKLRVTISQDVPERHEGDKKVFPKTPTAFEDGMGTDRVQDASDTDSPAASSSGVRSKLKKFASRLSLNRRASRSHINSAEAEGSTDSNAQPLAGIGSSISPLTSTARSLEDGHTLQDCADPGCETHKHKGRGTLRSKCSSVRKKISSMMRPEYAECARIGDEEQSRAVQTLAPTRAPPAPTGDFKKGASCNSNCKDGVGHGKCAFHDTKEWELKWGHEPPPTPWEPQHLPDRKDRWYVKLRKRWVNSKASSSKVTDGDDQDPPEVKIEPTEEEQSSSSAESRYRLSLNRKDGSGSPASTWSSLRDRINNTLRTRHSRSGLTALQRPEPNLDGGPHDPPGEASADAPASVLDTRSSMTAQSSSRDDDDEAATGDDLEQFPAFEDPAQEAPLLRTNPPGFILQTPSQHYGAPTEDSQGVPRATELQTRQSHSDIAEFLQHSPDVIDIDGRRRPAGELLQQHIDEFVSFSGGVGSRVTSTATNAVPYLTDGESHEGSSLNDDE